MNNNYRLQVRHHSEMFDSRESAFEYICGTFKYDSLVGEPAIFLYGDKNTKKPNVMLAFGAGDKKFALIDIANVEEKVEVLENVTALTQQDLEETTNVLMSAIESCGLNYDSNKIANKVSFEPDIKDVVLREAKTITEALAMLSQYTQEHIKDKNLSTKDTKSVTLSYVPLTDGMELSAVVNISVYGDSDEDDFNNNIIGVKDDGLYATSNLEYDPDKHTLTFTSSGMKNGRFQDDAKKKIIELGEHSIYTESNEGHNIELKISKIDASHSTISADVKISEDVNNIFTTQDGKLFVDGRASNIKYNKTTVADELKSQSDKLVDLSNELQEVIDSSVIKGVATDSAVVEATKGLSNEGYVIKSNVRLSDDNSIVVANGGLSANISVKVDTHNNKLFLNVGNNVIEQDLPGVNLIDNIVYDQTAAAIVITFDNGKVATIPVDDLLNDYTFNNINGQPVVVETSNNTDGSINIATRLNLRSTDNILSVDNGLLYAPKSAIDNAVAVETQRAESAEANLNKQIQEEIVNRTESDASLSDAILNNSNAIKAESERAKIKETEIDGVVAEFKTLVNTEIETIKSNAVDMNNEINFNKEEIGQLKTSSQSLLDNLNAEINRAKTAEDTISFNLTKESERSITVEDSLKALIDAETANRLDDVNKEQSRAEAAEAQLQANLDKEVVRATGVEKELDVLIKTNTQSITSLNEKVAVAEEKLNILNGGVDVKGSVQQTVKHASDDVLKDAQTYTDTVANTKANVGDAYTKSEIDEKNFLREHQDISHLATKEESATKQDLSALELKVDNIELDYNAASNVITFVDGNTTKTFTLSSTAVLKNGTYDEINKAIVLELLTQSGEVNFITIPVSDLVSDFYTITEVNEKFATIQSVEQKANASDVYTKLEVVDMLSNKYDKSDVYTKAEIEAKGYLTEHQDISHLATKEEISVKANIDTVYTKDVVDTKFDGLTNIYAFKEMVYSKDEANDKFAAKSDVYNREDANMMFATKEEVSVKADSENVYTIKQTDDLLLNKANVGDAYTKAEIEAKGYLTEHQDISHLATKESVFTKEEIIDAYVTKENADAMYSTINTVEQLNTKLDNIDLQYNAARNVLVFNDGNNVVEYALSGHTALVEGKYENGYIILTVQTQDGNTNQIKFSVESLVANMYTDVEVDAKFADLDTKYSTIESVLELENLVNTKANTNDVYTKSQIDDKKFLVKEDVLDFIKKEEVEKNYLAINKAVANKANNLIYLDGATGGLYASNQSADMYTKWVHLGQTSILTVEEAIGLLKTNIDAINFTGVNEDITGVRNSITVLEKAFNDYKTTVNSQLASILERVSALELKNITIESEINGLKTVDTTMGNQISTLQSTTSELGNRTTALESKVNVLKNTDPDVATALSVLTGQGKDVFTDDKQTLSEENLTEKPLSVDMGEY